MQSNQIARSQFKGLDYSQKNHKNANSNAQHSQQPNPRVHAQENNGQIKWVASYIDGQYYLSDPKSLQKLKLLEMQIQKEKAKLIQLDNENSSVDKSFLSDQGCGDHDDQWSNLSIANTEYNQNKHEQKKQKVKLELEHQEEKYRVNIRNMQKKRSELKQHMKTNEKNANENLENSIKKDKSKKQSHIELQNKSQLKEPSHHQIQIGNQDRNHHTQHNHEKQLSSSKNQLKNQNHVEKELSKSKKSARIDHDTKKSEKSKCSKQVQNQQIDQRESHKNSKMTKSIRQQEIELSKKYQAQDSESHHLKFNHQIKSIHQNSSKSKPTHSQKSHKIQNQEIHSKSNHSPKIQKSAHSHQHHQHVTHQQEKKSEVKSAHHENYHKADQLIQQKSQKNSNHLHLPQKVTPSHSKHSHHHSEHQKQMPIHHIQQKSEGHAKISQKSDHHIPTPVQSRAKAPSEKQVSNKKSKSHQSQQSQQSKPQLIEDAPKSKKSAQIDKESSVKSNISSQRKSQSKKEYAVKVSVVPSQKSSVINKEMNRVSQNLIKIDKADKSIQWSDVQISEKKSLQNDSRLQSLKSSSIKPQPMQDIKSNNTEAKFETLHNEIKLQNEKPEYNMKKKKFESSCEQDNTQKKGNSFIIRSRQGSVKQKSEKQHYESKMGSSNIIQSKISNKKSQKSAYSKPSSVNSFTKQQIQKLNQQIILLQQKLKKVEEKQDQIQKFEGTLSKINQEENNLHQSVSSPLTNLSQPIPIQKEKVRPTLTLEKSIIQINTTDEIIKKQTEKSEALEKLKLQEEIGRLKKIIRDMQMDKIKSIDHNTISSKNEEIQRNDTFLDLKAEDNDQNKMKQSVSSIDGVQTQKKPWNSAILKSRIQDAGKIIKNSPERSYQLPNNKKKASISKMRLHNSQSKQPPSFDEEQNAELPLISGKKNINHDIYKNMERSEVISKINEKQKNFHNFVQSSRVIPEENNSKVELQSSGIKAWSLRKQTHATAKFNESTTKFNEIPTKVAPTKFNEVAPPKINYSRMVQEMKRSNPEDEEDDALPQIELRDINTPKLSQAPTVDSSQEQLLSLAKSTYKYFGIEIQNDDGQLSIKKYKNCVIFSLGNGSNDSILWHYSGKFYRGGWKNGEQGEGQKTGEGLEYIPDKHIYNGQFLNGKKNGTGIIKTANGNIYDGQWIDGVKNGRGVYFDAATKVIYSGEWKDGKKDGYGFLKLSQKQYYLGTFVKSVKDGFGIELFVNGDKYKGQYKNGKFHGKGKYCWINGSCYQGQFYEGMRHGQGSWRSAATNFDIYIGTYQNDKKNGYGRYVWANGCTYEGGFSKDVKHGKGRLTYQDGKEVKGVWSEGNLQSTQNEKRAPVDHEDEPLRKSMKIAFGPISPTKKNSAF